MKLSYRWKRWLVHLKRGSTRNQGNWHWLRFKPMPVAGLNRVLWQWAEPRLSYYVMLLLSGIIATLGLVANNSATIIGAMIIAPLMGPITAIAFALAMGNRRLLKRSMVTITTGVALTVITAAVITLIVGLEEVTPEIAMRTKPTILDLGVALAAGAAGAYAKTHKNISDALPGVAIAVALVPPISLIGVGLAMPSQTVLMGSSLLFVTNLAGIILSGTLVFIWQDYGSLYRAKGGLTLASLALVILALPLGLSFRELLLKEQTHRQVQSVLKQMFRTNPQIELNQISIQRQSDYVVVDLEFFATPDALSDGDQQQLYQALQQELQRPVELNLLILPVNYIQIIEEPDVSQGMRHPSPLSP